MDTNRFVALSALLLATLAGACAPVLATTPVHFLETAEVLPAGRVALTGAAGASAGAFQPDVVGGAGRLRLGLGGGHEVGAELAYGRVLAGPNSKDDNRDYAGDLYAAKASWKYAPIDHLAFEAGLGAASGSTGDTVGGDLAALVSFGPEVFQVYSGIRGTAAFGTGSTHGNATALTVPLGLALHLGRTRVYAEAGLHDQSRIPDLGKSTTTPTAEAVYGALGLSFEFGPQR